MQENVDKSTYGQEALQCRMRTKHQNSFFQRQKATMLMKSKIANADDKVDTCPAQAVKLVLSFQLEDRGGCTSTSCATANTDMRCTQNVQKCKGRCGSLHVAKLIVCAA